MPRGYTLPVDLLAKVDALPNTRTGVIRAAIDFADENSLTLVAALERRLLNKSVKRDHSVRIGVSLTEASISKLAALTSRARLGTEHVLHLALEAYIDQITRRQPIKLPEDHT